MNYGVKSITTLLLILFVVACNKHKTTPATDMQQSPGYQAAQLICTQCHALPNPDQFHPAAWPSVIERMEGHIRANNKILPSEQQRVAILEYFQNSGGWKK
ncbi:MAG: hypothetical protein Q7S51_10110 [Gallionellaceae bacterium]|nr:hypothetical protein [Gallionellaceae bacterium]